MAMQNSKPVANSPKSARDAESMQPATAAPQINPRLALAAIVALLIVFAGLAYFAVSSKAPTYDEPLHALGAWQQLWTHDFRVNPEDPPLWKYWAALPNGPR